MKKKTINKRIVTRAEEIHYIIYKNLDNAGISAPYEWASQIVDELKERKLIYPSKK